jgi:hypothetical protein
MNLKIYMYLLSLFGEVKLNKNILDISTHKLTDSDPNTRVGEMGLVLYYKSDVISV